MKAIGFAIVVAFACTTALANTHKEAPGMAASGAMGKQQSKMQTCNDEAKGKTGDERKAFMKTCLMTQQNKMKQCNADAAGKKGDERKAFMKTCLAA